MSTTSKKAFAAGFNQLCRTRQRVMMARVEKPDQFSGNGKKPVRRGGS